MAKKPTSDDRKEQRRLMGFEALVDSAKSNSYGLEDTDGEYRSWQELSTAGKIRHLANDAAYYNVPFEAFAQEVRNSLSHLPPEAREEAALQVAFQIEGEQHQLAKLLPKHDRVEPYPLIEQFRDTLNDLRETVADQEGDARIGRAFKETVAETARQQDGNTSTLHKLLNAPARPKPEHGNKPEQPDKTPSP